MVGWHEHMSDIAVGPVLKPDPICSCQKLNRIDGIPANGRGIFKGGWDGELVAVSCPRD